MSVLLAALGLAEHPDACGDFEPPDDDGAAGPGACALERWKATKPLHVIDLLSAAATAVYRKTGKVKRDAEPMANMRKRRVVIALHQFGVELPVSWPSWHKVTAHFLVRADGSVIRNHPLATQLLSTNRFNRAPWHAIAIEIVGNFEGVDGSGRWHGPPKNGRGRMSDGQAERGRELVRQICTEVRDLGGEVEAIVPHIVAGRDRRGKPNRQICPGSRVWGEIGERCAAELDLAVPGVGFKLGGLPIPDEWRSAYFPLCRTLKLKVGK